MYYVLLNKQGHMVDMTMCPCRVMEILNQKKASTVRAFESNEGLSAYLEILRKEPCKDKCTAQDHKKQTECLFDLDVDDAEEELAKWIEESTADMLKAAEGLAKDIKLQSADCTRRVKDSASKLFKGMADIFKE